MAKVAFVIIILFLLAVAFIISLAPKDTTMLAPEDITMINIPPSVSTHTISKDTATFENTLSDSLEKDGDDEVQVSYYIIVGSFRNITLAQQKAETFRNDLNKNIIVLPPTKEGYCRISYGKYSTIEEAKYTIKSLRKDISSDAWIYSVKK
jgi:hypothetical protein